MENGIILIDKDKGMTSRDVDNKLGKILKTKHIGHLGTLDPFATGLLIIGVNKGNKCLSYIDDSKKTYIASLILGEKTTTGDPEGEIIETMPVPVVTDKEISAVLDSFIGKSMQIPPMTSAIKVDGKPLYKLAHKGKEIERKPREIEVFEIKLIFRLGKQIDFLVTVSKGTYIRTLAEDIASRLNCVGHLEGLRRLKIGNVSLVNSHTLEEFEPSQIINPLDFISLPKIKLSEKESVKVKNGVRLNLDSNEDKVCLVFNDEAIAIYSKDEDGTYKSERGLF